MSKHTVTALVPFAFDHMAAEVTFEYRAGRPAVMYLRNGDPGYPADPAEVEFISVKPEAGVTLTPALQKAMTDWCEEWVAGEGYYAALEAVEADDERAAEYAAELRRDA